MNTTRIPLASCRRIHDRCRRLDEQARLDDWNGHTEAQMRFSALILAAGFGFVLWGLLIFAVYGFSQACRSIFR